MPYSAKDLKRDHNFDNHPYYEPASIFNSSPGQLQEASLRETLQKLYMAGCQNYGPFVGVHIQGDIDIDV